MDINMKLARAAGRWPLDGRTNANADYPYYMESEERWDAFIHGYTVQSEYDDATGTDVDWAYGRWIESEERYAPVPANNPSWDGNGDAYAYIVVWEIDRYYGGPQEGGYWIDSGVVVASVPVWSLTEARETMDRLRARFPSEPTDGPGVDSVAYRGGAYSVGIDNGKGTDYPGPDDAYDRYC